MKNREGQVSLCAVGDVCINREVPESAFEFAAPVLNEADIAFFQLETMYTERGNLSIGANVPLRSHPRNIAALNYAGLNIASLAGNHVMDFGPDGILDTIELI